MSDDDHRAALPADFPSRVAHEIRSPLNLLAGALSELTEADAAGKGRLLALGRRGVAKLIRLADRLSLLARISDGELDRAPTRFALSTVVRQVTDRAADRAGRRRVDLELDVGDAATRVRGDAALLGAAIEELVDNAFAHARSRVSVRTEVDDGTARVVVANDGRLLSPETADSLFVLHGTERPRGGLHIGLALARAIARAHEGTVELLGSDEANGTRFALVLPLAS